MHAARRPDGDEVAHEFPRLVPITVEGSSDCEIILVNGRRLRFPETLPPTTLRAILAAMEAS